MTLLAAQTGVTAQQRIAGLAMVELLLGCLPFVDTEGFAVMLRVAPCAILVAFCRVDRAPMVALVLAHQRPNLAVARLAFEPGRTRAKSKNMATGTFQRAIQRTMGMR